ncbi:MAG TPA: 4a-hydroxytetrahydrobiopterin dehydratase [Oscillatoriales cyanobacterium M59_W2019_021]|nr:MAG: 4a-hydroxytetrahydrobiopterin dehydratase [Cyanobacteria bacterium J055]HIK31484.1 4a-hydroxytetrahydrobiopterin dehydratase [Oscillatoriales cyanobacterium M4454_W2019_049]HIK51188.1 4a-hydroxytetrahydrobiopterin dehydratase [Oscillatoriales cyanobacterium M59_W2019_021]
MTRLNDRQIQERASQLPNWTVDGKTLTRTWTFENFIQAIEFVNRLVDPAERAGHHPDISISYNKVNVSLTTHDAGGLTDKDFELAGVLSDL